MSQPEQYQKPDGNPARAGKVRWVVGGLLLVFAAAAAMLLPRGYSDNLSRIGKGRPAVVMIRDKNAVPSFDLIHVLDGVRDDYAGRIEFLLTDFDTQQGRAFLAANNAAPASLVLIDASGRTLKVLFSPQTTENVRQEIAGAFGIKP